VHSGVSRPQNMDTLFFILSWIGMDSIRTLGHIMSNLCFCIRWDLLAMLCSSVRPGRQNGDALFSILGWARCSLHKKRTGTRYGELMFLHLLGSVVLIVHYGTSGPQNIDTPCLCSGGSGAVSIKSAPGYLALNLCFCIR
jgi:hypothetical protein